MMRNNRGGMGMGGGMGMDMRNHMVYNGPGPYDESPWI